MSFLDCEWLGPPPPRSYLCPDSAMRTSFCLPEQNRAWLILSAQPRYPVPPCLALLSPFSLSVSVPAPWTQASTWGSAYSSHPGRCKGHLPLEPMTAPMVRMNEWRAWVLWLRTQVWSCATRYMWRPRSTVCSIANLVCPFVEGGPKVFCAEWEAQLCRLQVSRQIWD